MDRAFDILNSKSKYGKGYKQALSLHRMTYVTSIYESLREYLLSLKDAENQPLCMSRRRTFIVGFICSFQSALMLAEDLFQNKDNQYFLTFRMSQDFIETFFSKIRRMGGCNNNPTASQFRSALRRLLCKQQVTASQSANVSNTDLDTTEGLFMLSWSKRCSLVLLESCDEDLEAESVPLDKLPVCGEFKQSAIAYIAGYVVRGFQGKISCQSCSQQLVANTHVTKFDHPYAYSRNTMTKLIDMKNKGGLVYPSSAVINLFTRCEQVMSSYLSNTAVISKPSVAKKLFTLTLRTLFEDQPIRLFEDTNCELISGSISHSNLLTRQLLKKYIDIRLKHHSRVFNDLVAREGRGSCRQRLHRLVIFRNQ